MSEEVVLSIDAGARFELPVTIKDSNGAAVDLTGAVFEWYIDVIGPAYYSGTPEIVVDSDPTSGKLTLKLTGTQTALYTRVRGFHRLRMTPAGVTDGPDDVIKGAVDVNTCG